MTDKIVSHVFMKCPACDCEHEVEVHEQITEHGSQNKPTRRLYYLCKRGFAECEFEDVLMMEENGKNSI